MLSDTKANKGLFVNFLRFLLVGIWENFWELLRKIFYPKQPKKLYELFYEHPIIKNYGENLLFKKPSYLTSENFSTILIDTIKNLDKNANNSTANLPLLRSVIQSQLRKEMRSRSIDKDTLNILLHHMNEAAGDLSVFKFRIEKWYNDTMDRVSGWYKRNTQFYLTAVGIFLAVSLNIDSIQIAKYLSSNKLARDQLAQMGSVAVSNPNFSSKDSAITKEALDTIRASMNKVNTLLGLGWGDYGKTDPVFTNNILRENNTFYLSVFKNNKMTRDTLYGTSPEEIYRKILEISGADARRYTLLNDGFVLYKDTLIKQQRFALLYDDPKFKNSLQRKYVWYRLHNWEKLFGFLITALAIGLGAPLWFDLLNKFTSLRTAVKAVNSSGSTTNNNSTSTKSEIDG